MTKKLREKSHLRRSDIPPSRMTQAELAQLGSRHVAYIKVLSLREAKRLFPSVAGIPSGVTLYALQAADGTPIALTDTREAALMHAQDGDLRVTSIH